MLTTAGQDVGVGGVHNDGSDVVRVCLKCMDLLQSVVVEDPDLHVVRTCHHPALTHHKLGGTNCTL